ncbi:VOC family protein [Bacillus sp. B1-b2]|uniref:SMU1112c/YaeR family gloxylase I-like metalloprotein n=1 Tax=Bacillus sp. B1-b2 TaxID=2653201 RepID=UPI0012616364|nr:VOC family protein [Bacillus sp. B1-b2]
MDEGGNIVLKVNDIHHIAIICSNYEVSKHFYVNLLGFKPLLEVYREDRDSYKLDLMLNDVYKIELFSFPNPKQRPSHPEACGLRHLALEVNDMIEAVQWLESNNIIVEDIRIDPFTEKRYTFFADPDGLPIELYEA